eukprot:900425-Karenia_brevis.AAC.1
MFQFVLKYSGGLNAQFLRQTERICKTSASSRLVSIEMWDALANTQLQGVDQGVRIRHAMLQILYTTNYGTITAGSASKAISVGDVRKMQHNKATWLRADAVINNLWMLTLKLNIADKIANETLKAASEQIVFKVMDKDFKDLTYMGRSIETIAYHFFTAMLQASKVEFFEDDHDVVREWRRIADAEKNDDEKNTAATKEAPKKTSAKPPAMKQEAVETAMRAYGEDSVVIDVFHDIKLKGFMIGSRVQRPADKVDAHITGMKDEHVHLSADGKNYKVSLQSFVNDKWKLSTHTDEEDHEDRRHSQGDLRIVNA